MKAVGGILRFTCDGIDQFHIETCPDQVIPGEAPHEVKMMDRAPGSQATVGRIGTTYVSGFTMNQQANVTSPDWVKLVGSQGGAEHA
jgi:hypothetical protein